MKITKEQLKSIKIINFVYHFSIRVTANRCPKVASKIKYFGTFGRKLNLKNPKTFNEKLMWIKLNEDDTLKTLCTDKYKVRKYVSDKGLRHILNTTYYVYDNTSQINYDLLPNKFVLKCNKGSGGNIICRDKSKLDIKLANEKLDGWLSTDYSLISAETHGKNIEPKIICEEYLDDPFQKVPVDYKFHCFNGQPLVLELVLNRYELNQEHILLDLEWNNLEYTKYKTNEDLLSKRKIAPTY